MIPPPRSRFVELDRGTLHIADHGGSGPPIVLVHGLGGSHVNWAAVAPRLTAHGRVVALDLPGFGLSPPARHHDLDTHAAAVSSVINHLDGGPALVVGNSMGGLVAEMVAAHHPGRVNRLVLLAPATPLPPGMPPADRGVLVRLALQSLPGVGAATIRLLQMGRTPAELVDLTLDIVSADPSQITPELRTLGVEMAERRAHQPWAVRAFAESAASVRRMFVPPRRFEAMLELIEAPAEVVIGTEDRVVTPAAVEALCRDRPGWQLTRLEGIGHVPMLEAPATTAELVLAGGVPSGQSTTAPE